MKQTLIIVFSLLIGATIGLFGGALFTFTARPFTHAQDAPAQPQTKTPPSPGYILERESEVKQTSTGPHNGQGASTGYGFFDKEASFKYVIRKRVLHPGATIGYHLQRRNEVYYLLSGKGTMQMNGKEFPVVAGDAVLTLGGSSHGLKQEGKEDLVMIVSYEKPQP
jgi:mannose-6-phosphate isomerase-like protein (cupin superfamily)